MRNGLRTALSLLTLLAIALFWVGVALVVVPLQHIASKRSKRYGRKS